MVKRNNFRSITKIKNLLALQQAGYALPTALFTLAILVGLSISMLSLLQGSRQEVNSEYLGNKLMLAAQSGIEWGTYRLVNQSTCDSSSTTINIEEFTSPNNFMLVKVRCFEDDDTSPPVETKSDKIYHIRATAEYGSWGEQINVWRQVDAIVHKP